MCLCLENLLPLKLTSQQTIICLSQIEGFPQTFDFGAVVMDVVVFELVFLLDRSLLFFEEFEPLRFELDVGLTEVFVFKKLTDPKFKVSHFLALQDELLAFGFDHDLQLGIQVLSLKKVCMGAIVLDGKLTVVIVQVIKL